MDKTLEEKRELCLKLIDEKTLCEREENYKYLFKNDKAKYLHMLYDTILPYWTTNKVVYYLITTISFYWIIIAPAFYLLNYVSEVKVDVNYFTLLLKFIVIIMFLFRIIDQSNLHKLEK